MYVCRQRNSHYSSELSSALEKDPDVVKFQDSQCTIRFLFQSFGGLMEGVTNVGFGGKWFCMI